MPGQTGTQKGLTCPGNYKFQITNYKQTTISKKLFHVLIEKLHLKTAIIKWSSSIFQISTAILHFKIPNLKSWRW